ncbi:ABC transporter substrate-binding protein [Actinopolymorpha sp. B17G11]|uniref:ABC transporter substrate-binding protein n=1 Tax=Actinopolymorpha sp. B17G11 TaxID=3160861 RepID=UPI0032E50899
MLSSFRFFGILAAGALALAACGGMEAESSPSAGGDTDCESTTKVRVVLQWVAQAQFAGYYQAKDKGYYADECLDVTIQEGGVDVVPQQVLASGNAEFAVSHVTKTLATREEGADLVNIGQVFQRGAYLEVAWADSEIKTIEDFRGKKLGSWGKGNELVQYAALRANGIEPEKDARIIQQSFDMSQLLKREVDVAVAKTYNEYAQVLEQVNPKTGKLYQPEDFVTIDLQEIGFASLEDGIYANGDWLAKNGNEDVAVRFLKATYQGWASCRDEFDSCVDTVLDNGSALGAGHQTWQLNEINKLIWPSPDGIGAMDTAAWDQTVEIAIDGNVLKGEPSGDAYRTDLSEKAVAELEDAGVDATGADFRAKTVKLTEGGE